MIPAPTRQYLPFVINKNAIRSKNVARQGMLGKTATAYDASALRNVVDGHLLLVMLNFASIAVNNCDLSTGPMQSPAAFQPAMQI